MMSDHDDSARRRPSRRLAAVDPGSTLGRGFYLRATRAWPHHLTVGKDHAIGCKHMGGQWSIRRMHARGTPDRYRTRT